ncbi:MAG: V-type ATP synthase subunit D [Candidatus Omnitrophota bacterium]|nr:V-type ATP synthase subunit D [Candidatus Omnitrophota bacterium]
MRANIAATKTNLLKVKKTLSLTEEGYELLDEKRKLLIRELTSVIHIVDKAQRDVDLAFTQGYDLVDKAMVVMGRRKLEELSFSIDIKSNLFISQQRVMGVNMPAIELKIIEKSPYYSPAGVSIYVEEVILRFKDLLKLLAQLAEKKIALLRIAREVQRTIRKVNALEKIHLPFYRETLKYIGERLEEESRDSFSMLKIIKQEIGRVK